MLLLFYLSLIRNEFLPLIGYRPFFAPHWPYGGKHMGRSAMQILKKYFHQGEKKCWAYISFVVKGSEPCTYTVLFNGSISPPSPLFPLPSPPHDNIALSCIFSNQYKPKLLNNTDFCSVLSAFLSIPSFLTSTPDSASCFTPILYYSLPS